MIYISIAKCKNTKSYSTLDIKLFNLKKKKRKI